jgi:hypothetical protein
MADTGPKRWPDDRLRIFTVHIDCTSKIEIDIKGISKSRENNAPFVLSYTQNTVLRKGISKST